MKKYSIILSLLILSFTSIYSQDILVYRQVHSLEIKNLRNQRSYISNKCLNISDYCISENKIFVVASSSFQNRLLCSNEDYTKLFYAHIDFNDTLNLAFIEIPVKNPLSLYLGPNDKSLLMISKNYESTVVDVDDLSFTKLPLLTNVEIIGWWSSSEILYKIDSKLLVYDLEMKDYKIIYELEELKYYSIYRNIKNFSKIGEKKFLLIMKEKNLDKGLSLYYFDSYKLQKIHTTPLYFLDFSVVDSNNVVVLDSRFIVDRGDEYILTKINLYSTAIEQINLTELLEIESIRSMIRLSDNVAENKIIFSVDDPMSDEKDGFYELNLCGSNEFRQLLSYPLLMVEDIYWFSHD